VPRRLRYNEKALVTENTLHFLTRNPVPAAIPEPKTVTKTKKRKYFLASTSVAR